MFLVDPHTGHCDTDHFHKVKVTIIQVIIKKTYLNNNNSSMALYHVQKLQAHNAVQYHQHKRNKHTNQHNGHVL